MSFYSRMSFVLFGSFSESVISYLTDLKSDLKKARLRISAQEYMSTTLFTTFLGFLVPLPVLSFFFALFFQEFLFGFITAFTVSIFIPVITFLFLINYPKFIIQGRAKAIDDNLPFAALYLSTVAGSKLPLHKTFEIFSRYSGYGEITKQTQEMVNDIKSFGLDFNTAIGRQMERTPSKKFTEILWGLLSALRVGADLNVYLKEKSVSLLADYRRRIYEFSHTLTLFIELYLTSIVLGTIFFTILTAIIAGLGGVQGNIIVLQFFLIFILLPIISIAFITLIRVSTPGGE